MEKSGQQADPSLFPFMPPGPPQPSNSYLQQGQILAPAKGLFLYNMRKHLARGLFACVRAFAPVGSLSSHIKG